MHSKLDVFVKVPTQKDFVDSKSTSVWKGIRQGGVSSPLFYNNSMLEEISDIVYFSKP